MSKLRLSKDQVRVWARLGFDCLAGAKSLVEPEFGKSGRRFLQAGQHVAIEAAHKG